MGPNTTIRKSYIFGDARIGADCILDECILGDGVTLGSGVSVGKGALIGNGVRIAAGVQVPEFARIGREKYRADDYDSDDESDDEAAQGQFPFRQPTDIAGLDQLVLGSDSIGFVWPKEEEEEPSDSEDEGEDPYEHPRNKRLLQLGRRLSNVTQSSASLSTLSVASTTPPDSPMSLASSDDLDGMAHLRLNDGPVAAFYTEARASLARAWAEDHSIPNALLELKTLVMGYNSGIDLAREEVVNFFMSKVPLEGGAAKILDASTEIWERWGGLAASLSRDASEIAVDVQVSNAVGVH